MKLIKYLFVAFWLCLIGFAQAAPPALMTSSFMKHEMSFEECLQKTRGIMAKMNLEIEDHGNGTIGGFGEQSVAVVNCHDMSGVTYVQIAVASQKEEATETIMKYLVGYLRKSDNPPAEPRVFTQPPATK